jgi:hypothetical protein
MNMRARPVVAATIFLGGCATTANYEKMLNSWIGIHSDQLVLKWGPPSSAYTLSDGRRIFEYSSRRNTFIGGGTVPTGAVVPTSVYIADERVCITRFTIDALGTVRSWTWQGDDCTAPAPN